MKKFKFSLEKVLQHRRIIEDQANAEMLLAKAELNRQIDILEKHKTERSSAFQRRYDRQMQGANSGELSSLDLYIKGQDLRIENQKKVVQAQEKLVEEKMEILRKAALEVKMIEKLKEKKLTEFREEFLKHEQNEMDENTVLRHRSRDKGAE